MDIQATVHYTEKKVPKGPNWNCLDPESVSQSDFKTPKFLLVASKIQKNYIDSAFDGQNET